MISKSILLVHQLCCQGWSTRGNSHFTELKDVFIFICRCYFCPYCEKKSLFFWIKSHLVIHLGKKSKEVPRFCNFHLLGAAGAWHLPRWNSWDRFCPQLRKCKHNITSLALIEISQMKFKVSKSRISPFFFFFPQQHGITMVTLILEQISFARWQKNILISLLWAPTQQKIASHFRIVFKMFKAMCKH